jgi:Cof subfamily protein (haloacid dehalogenase superfamily)
MKNTSNHQLILSDIDGTLLNDEFKLLPSTENTIRNLVKSGILFATASARSKAFATNAILPIKAVCCANAYVNGTYTEASNGEVLIDSPMSLEDTSILIDQCHEIGASLCCLLKDEVIADVKHPQFKEEFKIYFGEYAHLSDVNAAHIQAHSLAVYAENIQPMIDVVQKHLPHIEAGSLVRFQNQGRWIEESHFQNKGINKGAALRSIAAYFGVDLSKTVAVGDGLWNDGPMIEAAGWGVAMKNAHKEIIHKADYVTEKDNNEDGLGNFLRGLFGL